jgi:hypothetical protein
MENNQETSISQMAEILVKFNNELEKFENEISSAGTVIKLGKFIGDCKIDTMFKLTRNLYKFINDYIVYYSDEQKQIVINVVFTIIDNDNKEELREKIDKIFQS